MQGLKLDAWPGRVPATCGRRCAVLPRPFLPLVCAAADAIRAAWTPAGSAHHPDVAPVPRNAELYLPMAKSAAVNQVYNVAVGDRSTLNELYGMMKTLLSGNFAHISARAPEYADVRRNGFRY